MAITSLQLTELFHFAKHIWKNICLFISAGPVVNALVVDLERGVSSHVISFSAVSFLVLLSDSCGYLQLVKKQVLVSHCYCCLPSVNYLRAFRRAAVSALKLDDLLLQVEKSFCVGHLYQIKLCKLELSTILLQVKYF